MVVFCTKMLFWFQFWGVLCNTAQFHSSPAHDFSTKPNPENQLQSKIKQNGKGFWLRQKQKQKQNCLILPK